LLKRPPIGRDSIKGLQAAILLIFLCRYLLEPVQAFAHEGLHEQIAKVTAQIKLYPNDASLYLKRGELYRLHRDWQRAIADYRQVKRLAPELEVVEFAFGLLFFEAGQFQQANGWLNRYLLHTPQNVEALVLRAKVLARLGKHRAAANDYAKVIKHSSKLKPDYFIERARQLINAGRSNRPAAIAVIDEGIEKLGPIVTLELFAIDIEVVSHQYAAALERLERLAVQSPRKETWLVRRGEILLQAGRIAEAHKAFEQALAAIESLPAYHRGSKAIITLEKRLRAAPGMYKVQKQLNFKPILK
jgi:tetratricopeptide (TPR) repeat protein